MIDDEDSKVRRNLVVMCTVVLAVTFLGIQPLSLLQEALKLPNLQIPPWKSWTISALVLLYLRYRFSTSLVDVTRPLSEGKRVRPSWTEIWEEQYSKLLKQLVEDEARRSFERPSKAIQFTPTPIEAVHAYHGGKERVANVEHAITQGITSTRTNPFRLDRGQCKLDYFNYELIDDLGNTVAIRESRRADHDFQLRHTADIQLRLRSAAMTVFTSEPGIQHNLPRLLSWLAWSCIAWQFYRVLSAQLQLGIV